MSAAVADIEPLSLVPVCENALYTAIVRSTSEDTSQHGEGGGASATLCVAVASAAAKFASTGLALWRLRQQSGL